MITAFVITVKEMDQFYLHFIFIFSVYRYCFCLKEKMHFSLNCPKQPTTLFPMKKDSFVPSVPRVQFAYVITKASNPHYDFNQAKYKCSSFLGFQQPLFLPYLLLNWAANHNCCPIRCCFINQLVKQPMKIKQPNVVDPCEPKSTKQSNCLTLEAKPELRRHYEDTNFRKY